MAMIEDDKPPPASAAAIATATATSSHYHTTKQLFLEQHGWEKNFCLIINNMMFSLLNLILIFSGEMMTVKGEICRRLPSSAKQKMEVFECPRIFESPAKSWCCQPNTLESYCCDWKQRAKEAGFETPFFQPFTIIMFIICVILSIMAIIYFLFCRSKRFCGIEKETSDRHPSSSNTNSQRIRRNLSHPAVTCQQYVPISTSGPEHVEDPPPSYSEAIRSNNLSNVGNDILLVANGLQPSAPVIVDKINNDDEEMVTIIEQPPYNPNFVQ